MTSAGHCRVARSATFVFGSGRASLRPATRRILMWNQVPCVKTAYATRGGVARPRGHRPTPRGSNPSPGTTPPLVA